MRDGRAHDQARLLQTQRLRLRRRLTLTLSSITGVVEAVDSGRIRVVLDGR